MLSGIARTILSAALCASPAWAAAEGGGGDRPWLDATRTPQERAALVVAAMTDEEKLRLLQGDTELDANGTGVNACVGHISGIARLGLPSLCMGDGPAGVGNGMKGVTQFPAPVMGAATFDRALMQAYGQALGTEHAGKGRNVVLAPTINIIRTPKWGRLAETLSEDPYLAGQLGSAITAGIQSVGVIATPKHFVANNQEWLRLGDGPAYAATDALVPERALHEIYFPAFESVVKSARAGSIMCAYNRVNGRYACENPATLGQLKTWGFDGFVVADWYFAHRSTVAAVKAGLDISMPGGVSPFGFAEFYGVKELKAARARGAIIEADIDGMVARIVTPMFRLGLVDRPVTGNANADVRDPAHLALSERIAEEGTVLLRNARGILPLRPGRVASVAVIGDDAGANVQTSERYGGFVKTEDIGGVRAPLDALKAALGPRVTVRYARGTLGIAPLPAMPASAFHDLTARYYASPDWSGQPVVTRKEATIDYAEAGPKAGVAGLPALWSARWTARFIPRRAGTYRFSLNGGGEMALTIDGQRVVTIPKQSFRLVTHGTVWLDAGKPVALDLAYSNAPTLSANEVRLGWQAPDSTLIDEAVAAAKQAQVAVVFVADHVSEGADRTDLRLPGDQDALIEAVAAANPNTVVVLHTVGPVLMPWRDKVAGILAAWYPGEQAADAIAALLTGKANPSGKLPVTFPADETHGPTDQPARYPGIGTTARYDEGILVGYRWYDAKRIAPLYPFGHGLSYTTFGYSSLTLVRDGQGWTVRVNVRNTGRVAGDEVAQLYVAMPAAAGEPPRQLKGFARVSLPPGEAATVSFPLASRDLSYWDEAAKDWRMAKGTYRIAVGASSRDIRLVRDFDPAR
ncbi:glycoside hydrolase family 3 C-terminal domain-containing protein [Novosphingobium sp. SG720]|uniref:glycoside hydrolase family 3 protein n=1 Tax=Novosphingobium sp. SG720 TaxID=2586998 RepID=UPI0014466494|nr:glycoside hydrolase family 3 C-terminal domain-containing protein [Novosphingobium sp. SG720]NKJ42417.1 beta-glucosidase [Novosphingobium sp. SG720]